MTTPEEFLRQNFERGPYRTVIRPNGKVDEESPITGYGGPEDYEERMWPDESERPDKPEQTEFDTLGVVWADDIQLELVSRASSTGCSAAPA
jgi:hypothetical protein